MRRAPGPPGGGPERHAAPPLKIDRPAQLKLESEGAGDNDKEEERTAKVPVELPTGPARCRHPYDEPSTSPIIRPALAHGALPPLPAQKRAKNST